VNPAAEHRAKDDPQKDLRAPKRPHDRSKDRTQSGDVEQLHQINTPAGHLDEVDTIGCGHRWGRPFGVRLDRSFDHTAVNRIPQRQQDQPNYERQHL
jgi:hypothetical protein